MMDLTILERFQRLAETKRNDFRRIRNFEILNLFQNYYIHYITKSNNYADNPFYCL